MMEVWVVTDRDSNKASRVHSVCPAQLRPTWWNKHTRTLETLLQPVKPVEN